MAILNDPNVPVVLTTEVKQAKLKQNVSNTINALYRQMLSVYNNNMAQIWNNSDGLTPQQCCDAFATDAAELFRLASVLSTAINAATPGTITTTPPATVTVNNDGTITLS